MFGGWSQLNENLQGDFSIIQQISALRRENRFLKVGLIFCLVIATLPYLTGFQPTVIRASKVVTKRIEFVRDGKTVISISLPPKGDGLVIGGRDELPVIMIARDIGGGSIVTFNKDGKIGASMIADPWGGGVGIYNNDERPVVTIGVVGKDGKISVFNKDGKLVWASP
jgi:hypothetical protein